MLFSLAFLTLQDCSPFQAIRAASAAGYDQIGLRLLPATTEESSYPLLSDKAMLREVQHILSDSRLGVGEIELIRLGPSSSICSFEPLLERAGELGAHHLVVVNDDPNRNRFLERFEALCERAAPYGLTVNIEPMTWTATSDLATAKDWLASVSHANAGIMVDALHFHRGNSSVEEFHSIPDQQVHIFQLCDALSNFDSSTHELRKISRTERLLPGEGELELLPLLRRLPDQVTVSIEVPNLHEAKQFSPHERAKRALVATKALVRQLQ